MTVGMDFCRTCNVHRDHFVYAPSQWETTLHCNVVSHWLGAYTTPSQWVTTLHCNVVSHWLGAHTKRNTSNEWRIWFMLCWVLLWFDNKLDLLCEKKVDSWWPFVNGTHLGISGFTSQRVNFDVFFVVNTTTCWISSTVTSDLRHCDTHVTSLLWNFVNILWMIKQRYTMIWLL